MRQDNVPGFPGYYISKSGIILVLYIRLLVLNTIKP